MSMQRFFRNNGLTIVISLLFIGCLFGQFITGYQEHNEDQREHGQPTLSLAGYLGSSHFLEATMENWESEFLQMFGFIALTAFLYQKGSAESKDPEKKESVDRHALKLCSKKNTPWPVRKGGLVLRLYENSLSLAFFLLFLVTLLLHAAGGAGVYNEEQSAHGRSQKVSAVGYMATSRFWFESMQNWQSDFLSVGSMVVLTIFLRQRGSPESKPVDSPHSETGSE
jgi:hypothetical protein